ncbi:protein ARV1 [Sitophilus oryzae]|uniref:Protein ARV n=1 Tax=Sitophilus oryzae TaxID=7048 RepID=A0A6J2XP07_SITOR|nr:protein ARV1 [Sitophilus oryzae]XP_030752605.1 protein ARV1 [Sitophilus oryzae]
MEDQPQYFCINCGERISSLYKKYSATVLKLTECEYCKKIADKYVEYDITNVVIGLILLDNTAYRHILLNTDFKHYWKLSLILILLEAYSNMTLLNNSNVVQCDSQNQTEPSLKDFDVNVEDLKFYILTINIGISFLCFVATTYLLTRIYYSYLNNNRKKAPSFILILKTITLASSSIFLQLPSVIWDLSVYSYHLHFISLYITLSQLLAYKVISSCPKIWCLLTIFSSVFIKSFINQYLNRVISFGIV